MRTLGLGDDLVLAGFRSDMFEVLDASDLIVFPSHLKACGRACFEAGAMGKPVIVTLPETSSEVVLDGHTGRVLPERRPDLLAEAISWYAANPVEARRQGERGFEHVRGMFDASMHAAKMMALYDEILQGEHRP